MRLFRRVRATLYRWRISRLDRRLDALQARRRAHPVAADPGPIALEFDALAIHRAVLARRLARLADDAPDAAVPRRTSGAPAQAPQVARYLQLDEELDAARASADNAASIERLTHDLVAAQRDIEAGPARRAP